MGWLAEITSSRQFISGSGNCSTSLLAECIEDGCDAIASRLAVGVPTRSLVEEQRGSKVIDADLAERTSVDGTVNCAGDGVDGIE
jgi:hypothetical protein